MKTKFVPMFVLVVAIAALVGAVGYTVANATADGGFGPMHRGSYSMMASGGKATSWYSAGTGPVTDIAGARLQAQKFADRLGLKTAEVMQFSNNFYVRLDDKAGHGATEVLVDPETGAVTLEYGPAMMWNTRYNMMGGAAGSGMMDSGTTGMMGGGSARMMGATGRGGMMESGMTGGNGMMGRYGGNPNWTPPQSGVSGPVSAARARQIANTWLAGKDKALTAGEPDTMQGYFTMETLRNGKIDGMLSVNASTGALWFHWWHGTFVAMEA
jgi:hypothetical protein